MEVFIRFALWASSLRFFPEVEAIMTRFEVCKATAYRWRNTYAAATGQIPPPFGVVQPQKLGEP